MAGHDILVVTLPPFDGGVPAKARILCEHLRSRGHKVSVAWYATFRHRPELNAPTWRWLAGHRPNIADGVCFGDFPSHAVGCSFPELEAPYYQPSQRWARLFDRYDRHIAVGGPPMVSHLLTAANIPHLLWCASDVMADRRDRQARMSWPRKMIDALVTRPWLQAQQRRILSTCPALLGVSRYTVRQLVSHGAPVERTSRLPIPVDIRRFTPPAVGTAGNVVGFAARFEDPRKNIALLLRAVATLRHNGLKLRLRLAGAVPSLSTRALVSELNLEDTVEFLGELPAEALPDFYRSLDVFVIPSHQEGLCIAGTEAMACGVPVVSTRCGGPEDFVRDGETGLLSAFDNDDMAEAIARIVTDPVFRAQLGESARHLVVTEYSPNAFAAGLDAAWRSVWAESP